MKPARELIAFSVEALPNHPALRALESNLGLDRLSPIIAQEILLPKAVDPTTTQQLHPLEVP